MRSLSALVLMIGLFCIMTAITAADENPALCPFTSDVTELHIGGYNIAAGWDISSYAEDGVILADTSVTQQAGNIQKQSSTADPELEIQGYSTGIHGQGTWMYAGGWNISGSDIDWSQALQTASGRINPYEESLMMSYACPPTGDETYPDNLTHVIGAETVYAWNSADLLLTPSTGAGWATAGRAGSEILNSAMAAFGTGNLRSGVAYQGITGIARNSTENVTYTGYTVVGNTSVPYSYTVQESRTVIVETGLTTMHGVWAQSGKNMQFQSAFHYSASRSAPYEEVLL